MIDIDELRQYAQDTIDGIPEDAVDCVEIRKCISISYLYAFHYGRERFYNHPKAEFKTLNDFLQHKELHDFFKRMKLDEIAHKIFDTLKMDFNCQYEEKDTIGRRYRRQDAIGTPYCITVDQQTKEDNTVTIRDRDTMEQERISVDKIGRVIEDKLSES